VRNQGFGRAINGSTTVGAAVGNAFMHSEITPAERMNPFPTHTVVPTVGRRPYPAEKTSKNLQPPTMIHHRRGRRPRRPGSVCKFAPFSGAHAGAPLRDCRRKSACKFAPCSRGDVSIAPYAPANKCPEHCRCPTGRRGRRPLRIHHHPP